MMDFSLLLVMLYNIIDFKKEKQSWQDLTKLSELIKKQRFPWIKRFEAWEKVKRREILHCCLWRWSMPHDKEGRQLLRRWETASKEIGITTMRPQEIELIQVPGMNLQQHLYIQMRMQPVTSFLPPSESLSRKLSHIVHRHLTYRI